MSDFYECGVADHPGPKSLYVVQRFSTGTSRIQFRLEQSAGFTGSLLSFSSAYNLAGDPSSGVSIDFAGCEAGNVQVMQLNYMFYGTSQNCSWISVIPGSDSPDGYIDWWDCIGTRHAGDGGGIHVDPDWGLLCPDRGGLPHNGSPFCHPYTPTVAVEASTWGSVKSLYR